jgi:ankyrin repeat protein
MSISKPKTLVEAASIGDIENVKKLISEGPSVTCSQDSALIEAVKNGHIEIVKILIENGADIDIEEEPPLKWAIIYGHIEIVKLLLQYGADPHQNNNQSMNLAIYFNRKEIIKYLYRIDDDLLDHDTLFEVYVLGDIDMIKYLISLGIKYPVGLNYAAEHGHIETVKYLLTLDNYINFDKETALVYALKKSHFNIADYLIDKGADIDLEIKQCYQCNCHCCDSRKNILIKYKIKKCLYIGETTETFCCICYEEFKKNENLFQCKTCKKCVHMTCQEKWNEECVYCRS